MVDIDLKDRKILYELDLNCRQSNAQIGKKVGLSKEVVKYRIKRLQDNAILTSFWTAINTYKLGFEVIRIYISFLDVNAIIKEEIINYFTRCKNTWAVISFMGEFDLDIVLWVKDFNEFYRFWNSTLERFGNYFGHQTISTLNNVIAYKKSYMLPDENQNANREYYNLSSGGEMFKIDKTDYQLLNILAVNARIPLVGLAMKLRCSSQTASYRINNLQKKNIIKAFRVGIDISKLGLQKFGISIYLKDHSKKRVIQEYLKDNPFLEYIDEAIGWADIQFELIVENMNHLLEIIDEINSKFPGAIRKHTFIMAQQYHKECWLPEISF
jgi:Lrp/AsnC family leucine-responsive transcriptional regulator